MTESEAAIAKWVADQGDAAWYGVDLDGSLAVHGTWQGPLHIGAPIPAMQRRVKRWLKQGRRVKIFTARVCEKDPVLLTAIVNAIQDWCVKHLGQSLDVANEKDYNCIEFWDDRAVQVVRNTGRRADGKR